MRIHITAPMAYLKHVLKDYPHFTFTDKYPDVLIPDPLKPVENYNYKIIATPSTGTNHIDRSKFEGQIISLMDNVNRLKNIRASSESAFRMILEGLHPSFRQWKHYDRNDDMMIGRELFGKYVGIVGYGRIGHNLSKYLMAFGARWDYDDPKYKKGDQKKRLFKTCDVVVLALTLNEETEGIITMDHLGEMKPNSVLVNVSRAEVINEDNLLYWCEKGGSYVTDVLHKEIWGVPDDYPLLHLPNVTVYPHQAGNTFESREKALRIILELLNEQ